MVSANKDLPVFISKLPVEGQCNPHQYVVSERIPAQGPGHTGPDRRGQAIRGGLYRASAAGDLRPGCPLRRGLALSVTAADLPAAAGKGYSRAVPADAGGAAAFPAGGQAGLAGERNSCREAVFRVAAAG